MKNPKILISVLNWNTSTATINCANSVLKNVLDRSYNAELLIIDNGSAEEDWLHLEANIDQSKVRLIRQSKNLGFAGGHNIAIQLAFKENFDFVWLVNSDAVVPGQALIPMLNIFENDSNCGAVSPLIFSLENEKVIDFCGARHDWERLESFTCTSVTEAAAMEARYPRDMWLMGAAIMLRTAALQNVGLLDESLFAYYEDNDICARLSKSGWTCRMAFEATVLHSHPESRLIDKKPYYFYLMARNSFKFWYGHAPNKLRFFLRCKLIDRQMLVANRLHKLGLKEKKSASLLGIYDAQIGKMGAWDLNRKPPFLMRVLRWALAINHRHHLRV